MVFAELFAIFAGGDAFDFYQALKDIAEFTMVDETEIFDIGEVVAEIASVEEEIEEGLGLGGLRFDGGLAGGGIDGILSLVADNAGVGFSVSEIKITD